MISCSKEQEIIGDNDISNAGLEHQEVSNVEEGLANLYLSEEMAVEIERNNKLPVPFKEAGIVFAERLFPYAGEFEARTRREGLHRWYTVQFDQNISYTKAGETFQTIPGVELVESVPKIKSTALPNDPCFRYHWNYYNTGTLVSGMKKGADINVVPVWENITTGSPDVVIAVVDGGIDYNHPDLQGTVDVDNSYNYVYNNSTIVAHDHGTHVAGTIGAISNNGIGVTGIAGGDAARGIKGVRMISLQVFQTVNGQDYSGNTVRALKEGADKGAVISQNSWGNSYKTMEQAQNDVTSSSYKQAIDYFNKYAGIDANGNQVGPMAGGVVFFAAGNDGWPYGHPCDYEGCIAVGSFNCTGNVSSYSNYGDWVDIAAPGGDDDLSSQYALILSTGPSNQYYLMAGTSMACPHVSGVAALLLSHYGGPGFTRQNLIDMLLNGANPSLLTTGMKNIGPKLDAWGSFSLGYSAQLPNPPSVVKSDFDDRSIVVSLKVPEPAGDVAANTLVVYAAKTKADLQNLSPKNPPENVYKGTLHVEGKSQGDIVDVVIPGLDYKTKYYYVAFTMAKSGSYSDPTPIGEIYVPENKPPYVIEGEELYELSIGKPGETYVINLSTVFVDPEKKTLDYTITVADESIAKATLKKDILSIYPNEYGYTKALLTCSDRGNTLEHEITIVVRDTSTPCDVYPNPCRNDLYFRSDYERPASVLIYSNTGALIMNKRLVIRPESVSVNVSMLSAGVYKAYIKFDDGINVEKTFAKL